MVMKVEPIDLALESLEVKKSQKTSKIILTSAKGKLFDQDIAKDYSKLKELTIICGHYEGVDERVAENLIDEEVRIGNYVLTGGEPAALVISDAVIQIAHFTPVVTSVTLMTLFAVKGLIKLRHGCCCDEWIDLFFRIFPARGLLHPW